MIKAIIETTKLIVTNVPSFTSRFSKLSKYGFNRKKMIKKDFVKDWFYSNISNYLSVLKKQRIG